jgi:hypothetical protein
LTSAGSSVRKEAGALNSVRIAGSGGAFRLSGFLAKISLPRSLDSPPDNETRRDNMADPEIVANQKTILQNQVTILENQQTILNNQGTIEKNQCSLDQILSNQKEIPENQKTIMAVTTCQLPTPESGRIPCLWLTGHFGCSELAGGFDFSLN